MVWTGCGPRLSKSSRIAKSERHMSMASRLRSACTLSARCAFESTNHRCVPEESIDSYNLDLKYLDVKMMPPGGNHDCHRRNRREHAARPLRGEASSVDP